LKRYSIKGDGGRDFRHERKNRTLTNKEKKKEGKQLVRRLGLSKNCKVRIKKVFPRTGIRTQRGRANSYGEESEEESSSKLLQGTVPKKGKGSGRGKTLSVNDGNR